MIITIIFLYEFIWFQLFRSNMNNFQTYLFDRFVFYYDELKGKMKVTPNTWKILG